MRGDTSRAPRTRASRSARSSSPIRASSERSGSTSARPTRTTAQRCGTALYGDVPRRHRRRRHPAALERSAARDPGRGDRADRRRLGLDPARYVRCSADLAIRPALQTRFIAEADAAFPGTATRVVDLDSSHSPFLSMPGRLATRDPGGVMPELGRVGIWSRELRFGDRAEAREAAVELEELGFGTLWIPGGAGDDELLPVVGEQLSATRRVVIATGILNVFGHDPQDVARAHARARRRPPGPLPARDRHRAREVPRRRAPRRARGSRSR